MFRFTVILGAKAEVFLDISVISMESRSLILRGFPAIRISRNLKVSVRIRSYPQLLRNGRNQYIKETYETGGFLGKISGG